MDSQRHSNPGRGRARARSFQHGHHEQHPGRGQYNQGQGHQGYNYSQSSNQGSSVAGQFDNTDGTQPGHNSVSTRPFMVQNLPHHGQNPGMRPPDHQMNTASPYQYEQQPHPRPMMYRTPPPGIQTPAHPPHGYRQSASGPPPSNCPDPRPPGISLAMGRGVNLEYANASAANAGVRMPCVPRGSMLTGFHGQHDNRGIAPEHQQYETYSGESVGPENFDEGARHPASQYQQQGYSSDKQERRTSETYPDQPFKVPSTPNNSEVPRSDSHSECRSRSSERRSPTESHRSRSRDTPTGRPHSNERIRGRSGDRSGSGDRADSRTHNYRSGSGDRTDSRTNNYRSPARGRGGFNLPPREASNWSSPSGSSQGSPVKHMRSPHYMSSPEYYRGDRQWSSSYSSSDGSSPYKGSRRRDDPTVFLSKTLSSILRHNAQNFGFTLMKGGYLFVDDILKYVQKLAGYTVEDIKSVVDSNDKKRFTLETDTDTNRLKIRANQGHSIQVEDLDLKPVTSADEVPKVIHGTYYESWAKIKNTGLSRMNRNHIHFAVGEPGDNEVISGMRSTCQVLVFIDMEKALKGGLKFYRSANNVILCPGNADGLIPPVYFQGVKDRIKGHILEYDAAITGEKLSETDKAEMRSKKRKKKGSRGKERDEDDEAAQDDPSLPAPKRHTSGTQQVEGAAIQVGRTEERAAQQDGKTEEGAAQHDGKTEEDWKDPIMVTDVVQSQCVVDHILSDAGPFAVGVICCGENLGLWDSSICQMIVLARPRIYVYHFRSEKARTLMKEGQLEKVLLSSKIHKVFNNIKDISSALVTEFDILLDGVPIWDVSMMYSYLEETMPSSSQGLQLKPLNVSEDLFKRWREKSQACGQLLLSVDDEAHDTVEKLAEQTKELAEQGKSMLSIYDILKTCDQRLMKELRKEIYAVILPKDEDSFLAEKIAQLKLEKKKEKQGKKNKAEGGNTVKAEHVCQPSKKSQKKGKKK